MSWPKQRTTIKENKLIIACKQDEPQVNIMVNRKPYSCLIDSGATYSALTEVPPEGKESACEAEITGIEGETETRPFINECKVKLEGKFGTEHAFLYTPKCPVNLLGKDLLCKMRAQINFAPGRIDLTVPIQQMFLLADRVEKPLSVTQVPTGVQENISSEFWDVDHPQRVIPVIPIIIRMKRGVNLPRLKQRPLSEAAVRGLKPLMEKYERFGLIETGISKCNTPIMAIPKPKAKETDQTMLPLSMFSQ